MKGSERGLGGDEEGSGDLERTVRQSRQAAEEEVSDKCCIWKRSREQCSLSSEETQHTTTTTHNQTIFCNTRQSFTQDDCGFVEIKCAEGRKSIQI